MSHELFLQILDTSYVVRSDDARWIDFMHVMWRPFCVHRDGRRCVPMEIAYRAPGWILCLPQAQPRWISDPWKLATLLEYVLIMNSLETATSVVGLHAAVLVQDGAALLLVGKSGTGKTTLALALAERGWTYFSDDLAAIDRSSKKVRSFPKPLSIEDPAMWRTLGSRWSPPEWLPAPNGEFLVPADIVRAAADAAAPVQHVLFPELVDEQGCDVVRMTAGEALTAARPRAWASDGQAFAILRSIFGRARSGRLRYSDTRVATDAIEQFVAAGCEE